MLKEKPLNATAKIFEVAPQNKKTHELRLQMEIWWTFKCPSNQFTNTELRAIHFVILSSVFSLQTYQLPLQEVYHVERNKKHISESSRKFFFVIST
jgi:hypothetical protein